jgi:hypothetical protein
MMFRLIGQAKKEFPVHRLCSVLGISQSGYFAWKDRPASHGQHEDIVLLAHVRSAFSLRRVAWKFQDYSGERGNYKYAGGFLADDAVPRDWLISHITY